MNVEILYRPSYSLAMVSLSPGERIRVESGAMVSMTPGMQLETRATGGLLASLKRSLLGRESFFLNEFQAPAQGGQIGLAPAFPGDLFVLALDRPLLVQSGSFLACSTSIEVDTRFGGAKTFFASEGLFLLRCSGQGQLILSSYGAIHQIDLSEGEGLTVDTSHLVAFEEQLGFRVRSIGGIKSTLFSGEGLVVDLTGPGRALMQTRSTDAFLAWLTPEMQRRLQTQHR